MKPTQFELEASLRIGASVSDETVALANAVVSGTQERLSEAAEVATRAKRGAAGGAVGGQIGSQIGGPIGGPVAADSMRGGGPVFFRSVQGHQGGPVEFRDIQRFGDKPVRVEQPIVPVQTLDGFPGHTSLGFLSPGVWKVPYSQFASVTGFNPHRTSMLVKAEPMFRNLQDNGADEFYAAGSFVTTKDVPNDIDALLHTMPGDMRLINRLTDLRGIAYGEKYAFAKRTFGVDLWQGTKSQGPNCRHFRYFQQNDGTPVGIYAVQLTD